MPPLNTEYSLSILPSAVTVGLSQGSNRVLLDSSADTLVAVTGGTIATALLVAARINRFTTVASTGACRLPPAVPGLSITIYNGQAVNALSVFPAGATQGGITGGDQVNAVGAGTAYSLAAGNSATFKCITLGQWYASQGALS